MPQVFHRSANSIAKISVIAVALFLLTIALAGWTINRSDYVTRANYEVEQPIQFSHKHHASDDGISCRYCHTSVEISDTAGIPPTQTCMNCHSQIWADSPYLEPVRESWRTGIPIEWVRVHDLPDFVYFNHSAHVSKGIGCSTCHGRVEEMALTYQVSPLTMEWCLSCHSQPDRFIRPRDQIYNSYWEGGDVELGERLKREYGVMDSRALTDCYTCHR